MQMFCNSLKYHKFPLLGSLCFPFLVNITSAQGRWAHTPERSGIRGEPATCFHIRVPQTKLQRLPLVCIAEPWAPRTAHPRSGSAQGAGTHLEEHRRVCLFRSGVDRVGELSSAETAAPAAAGAPLRAATDPAPAAALASELSQPPLLTDTRCPFAASSQLEGFRAPLGAVKTPRSFLRGRRIPAGSRGDAGSDSEISAPGCAAAPGPSSRRPRTVRAALPRMIGRRAGSSR